MDDLTQNALPQYLRSDRPLFGLTVLVVEDSKFACEGIRLLCLRSGARIRRADCLRSARRHLQVYRPSVVIIDLGLPDGNGAELIEELNAASPRVGIVLAISGDSFGESVALAAVADGFFAKPLIILAVFQKNHSFFNAKRLCGQRYRPDCFQRNRGTGPNRVSRGYGACGRSH